MAASINVYLLIALICIVVGLILFSFYFNRLIGLILGLILRVLWWGSGAESAWVHIGSIHFSLLSGRILIKNVAYHSSNQTIRIVKGRIQWRYWNRRTMEESDVGKQEKFPCRIQVSLQGFEWFMYNRTPAYDNIVAQMMQQDHVGQPVERRKSFMSEWTTQSAAAQLPPAIVSLLKWIKLQLPSLDFNDVLPIGIDITKGLIIAGNHATPNLLVAEFSKSEGWYGTTQARSKLDLYRQTMTLHFHSPIIRFVQNEDYAQPMNTLGEAHHGFMKLWRSLKLRSFVNSKFLNRRQPHSYAPRFHLRGRKNATDEDDGPFDPDAEYAIERDIIEAKVLELEYFVDVVGDVPPGGGGDEIGNGDVPPDWGVDLVIKGGTLRYGPWADRQRAELQKVFFPASYHNASKTPKLSPGDKRQWTSLRVFIELRDSTMLHIPFREASKNWQYDGITVPPPRPRKREPAWLHLAADDNSTIAYVMPMIATADTEAYEATLEVHLDSVKVTSSLNDIELVNAQLLRIHGALPSPLQWNAPRTWEIGVSLRQPVLYLLRDHVNMFTDLIKDWTSGPPSDYLRWVPVNYVFKIDCRGGDSHGGYELHTYVNDNNVIDRPLVKEDNAMLTMFGPHLTSEIVIPSDKFRPDHATVTFTLDAPDVRLKFSLPKWNTHALHAPAGGYDIGTLGDFRITGSYLYWAFMRNDTVDKLKLTFTGTHVAYKALGWTVRYFMVLKDNYFGSFTHYSTLAEFLEKQKAGEPLGDPVLKKYREGQNNMLEVEMTVLVHDSMLVVPCALHAYARPGHLTEDNDAGMMGPSLLLRASQLELHFRMNDFYMEMSLNIDNAVGHLENDFPQVIKYSPPKRVAKEVLAIDGLDITAHRLFGPVPSTVTYVCIWEIDVGRVNVIVTAQEAQLLGSAGKSFGLNFADTANAPAPQFQAPTYPDLTFLKVRLHRLDATWNAGNACLVISLDDGFKIDSNDRGGLMFRKNTSVRVPRISFRALLSPDVVNFRRHWFEAAEAMTDIYLDIYSAPKGWKDLSRAQSTFVREQDAPTGRAKRMFTPPRMQPALPGRGLHKNGVYLPQPALVIPTRAATLDGRYEDELKPDNVKLINRPWSKLEQLSESEREDGATELERDARLASVTEKRALHAPDCFFDSTQRLAPPDFMSAADNEASSSCDESDDEDLTDGSSSDEDLSDIDESQNAKLLREYARVTRRFTSTDFDYPSLLDDRPITLLYDVVGDTEPEVKSMERPSATSPRSPISGTPPRNDISTTVFRARCSRTNLRLTPLIAPVIESLLSSTETIQPSPELFIDGLLADSVSEAVRGDPDIQENMLDLTVHAITCRFFNTLPVSDVNHAATFPDDEGRPAAGSHPAMVMTLLSLHDLNVKASTSEHEKRAGVQLGDLSLSLAVVQNNRRYADTVEHANLRLGQAAPGYILASCIPIVKQAKDAGSTINAWSRRVTGMKMALLDSIVRATDGRPVIDPLSTIQPSFFVQSGPSFQLRTDPTFRFLFYTRSCLWDVRKDGKTVVPVDSSIAELQPLLLSRLLQLDTELTDDEQLDTLHAMLPKIRTDRSETLPTPLPSHMHLGFERLSLILLDSSGTAHNEINLSNFEVNCWRNTLELLRDTAPPSASQWSLKGPYSQSVAKTILSVSSGEVDVVIHPTLISFAQFVLPIRKPLVALIRKHSKPTSSPVSATAHPTHPAITDVTCSLKGLRVRAVAANLTTEFGFRDLQIVVSSNNVLHRHAANYALAFREVFFRGRTPSDASKRSGQDVLASLSLEDGKISLIERGPEELPKLVLQLHRIHLSVPRSALRLYRFIEEWRSDFLPGLEATLKPILSELKDTAPEPSNPSPSPSPWSMMHVHAQLSAALISLQVMHGTWLSWAVNDIVAYTHTPGLSVQPAPRAFGLQLGSQVFSVSSSPDVMSAPSGTRVKLDLPRILLSGRWEEVRGLDMLVLVDFLQATVRPSHWDTLLAVQQKFGRDFNDLMQLVQQTSTKRAQATSADQEPPSPFQGPTPAPSSPIYRVHFKMRGFRIGLDGAASTLFLECQDIGGQLQNVVNQNWDVFLSDLALSLAPRTAPQGTGSSFNRALRSAFVIIDFKVKGEKGVGASNDRLNIDVTKIHAVMQPSSIGELGDFVDDIQVEIMQRQQERAQELAAFKEKTQTIMRTFDVKASTAEIKETPSLLSDYVLNVTVRNVGFAFPVIRDVDLELPQRGRKKQNAVRAFLVSIKSLGFGTQRGESGQASIENFSFQFVSRFRQSVPADFLGDNHQTRNRLLHPSLRAQVRASGSAASRQVWVKSAITGFVLDLDSSISDYVFSLVDVYRQGKERLDRFSLPHVPSAPVIESPTVSSSAPKAPASSIFASLTFQSGKIRMYSQAASKLSSAYSAPHRQQSDEQILEMGAEVFNLPVFTLWMEYRALPVTMKQGSADDAPSILMFKSTVHSSQNTLRPTLLPFISELVGHINNRMRRVSLRVPPVPARSPRGNPAGTPLPSTAPSTPGPSQILPEARVATSSSSMQISFSLRIDQSKLELTCQPDVNVVAGVHWDSGGFMVNVSPGARKVTFTGAVGGLTIGLKHGFLSEECVKLDARNLAFSADFAKTRTGEGTPLSSISLVVDTEFLGGFRFSRLQDVLCFKAVWLDRIPTFQNTAQETTALRLPSEATLPSTMPSTPSQSQQSQPSQPKQDVSVMVLFRTRRLDLEADLGQSISNVSLGIKDIVLRTVITEATHELSLSVGDVVLNAKGNISGHSDVSNFVFSTIRRMPSDEGLQQEKMLELRMTSGTLILELESDHQKLLHYRAEPMEVEIFDDWSMVASMRDSDRRPLDLAFVVRSPEIVAIVTVATIPKLMSYANKFSANLDAQREGASRESKAFRIARTPKPDHPLSAVAEAMLVSARARFKEAETALVYVIKQRMSLRLDYLRLVVFPRTMFDTEVAQFVARDVQAQLTRLVESEQTHAERDIRLSFSSMTISKYIQVGRGAPAEGPHADGRAWLNALSAHSTEATIVGLPSMRIRMRSTERARELAYEFHSRFDRRDGQRAQEDIFITLNVALYSWLTLLRKNLTREMDQVRAAEDWRTALAARRPDSYAIGEGTRSATMPAQERPGRSSVGASVMTKAVSHDQGTVFPIVRDPSTQPPSPNPSSEGGKRRELVYKPGARHIERLTMRQLGEATPDVMHPFFMKKAGFSLEDSLPQYVHEYATTPLEEIMEVLLKLYSRQLLSGAG
uniref:Csf1 N-terminal domain-containing protein n=1 Tax=Schizophyllum commune (strain H4-8 / FGSC 9210) TaxID=578458 RepID=D8QC92_SCHCM